jgi:hypothetical protein
MSYNNLMSKQPSMRKPHIAKRSRRVRTGRATKRVAFNAYHIPLIVSAAIATTLIFILAGGGTGQFAGILTNAPDVAMKLDCPESGQKGAEITCTALITNEGNTFLTGLIVTFSPLDLVYEDASTACEKQANGYVICSRKGIGAIDPGKQDKLTITLRISTACPGDAYLAASANIAQRERKTKNNTDVERVTCD